MAKNTYVSVEKRSKKAQKEHYAKRRGSWNGLNPVTRVPESPKAYNRAKEKSRMDRYD